MSNSRVKRSSSTPNCVDPPVATGIDRFFAEGPPEENYSIPYDDIHGTIPSYVRGRYYVNGPAKFRRGDFQFNHWLDGDGMVACLAFNERGVEFRSRYVQTRKYRDEEKEKKPLYRTFGTRFPNDRIQRGIALESPSNVSVYQHYGSLLAYGEQSLPVKLDPETLETIGTWDFNGQLTTFSPFSAHPKTDPLTSEMFNFGISYAGREPVLNLYRFDANGKLSYRTRHTIDHPCSVHDFCLTEHYAVFCLSPYLLDYEKMTSRNFTIQESLHWSPELSTVMLVLSRDDGRVVARISTDLAYCLHVINGFEQNDKLVVDLIDMDEPVYPHYAPLSQLLSEIPAARPARLTIDLSKNIQAERQNLAGFNCPDFPAIDSSRHMKDTGEFWALGMSDPSATGPKLYDQLGHLSWKTMDADTFTAPPDRSCGAEPVYIPAQGSSGKGVVICQLINVECGQSSFGLFDGACVSRGPIAEIPLKSPMHIGFHACFIRSSCVPENRE